MKNVTIEVSTELIRDIEAPKRIRLMSSVRFIEVSFYRNDDNFPAAIIAYIFWPNVLKTIRVWLVHRVACVYHLCVGWCIVYCSSSDTGGMLTHLFLRKVNGRFPLHLSTKEKLFVSPRNGRKRLQLGKTVGNMVGLVDDGGFPACPTPTNYFIATRI